MNPETPIQNNAGGVIQPGNTPYYSAANPYSSGIYGGNSMSSSYSPYSSGMPFSGYGGGMSPYGGYGGYNPMMGGGDHMWQGFIGQTAEGLGRLNNLLSMTGMLVDHMSNHGKLLYSKGLEFHSMFEAIKTWSRDHSAWMEKLGLQIESSWQTNEDEEIRKRRMMVRRVRTMIIVGFFFTLFYYFRRSRRISRIKQWESIYYHPSRR